MKKLLFIIIAILLTVFLIDIAHGQTLNANYYQTFNENTQGIAAHELALVGYPQFGEGQMYVNPFIENWQKDPTVIYDYYIPTLREMVQWAQTSTGSPVTIYMVDRTSSITFRAVSGSITGKDGLSPSEALSNLLLKIKRVPYYTNGGQILWFLYGQN